MVLTTPPRKKFLVTRSHIKEKLDSQGSSRTVEPQRKEGRKEAKYVLRMSLLSQ
jgi:hypothetical protein